MRTVYPDEVDPDYTNVIFEGVQGYQFYNDAFGNIILGIEEISINYFVKDYGEDVLDSIRQSGTFTFWAKTTEELVIELEKLEVKFFLLYATIGMWGWVVAKKVDYLAQPQH